MNNEDIYNGITDIKDELIEGAAKRPRRRRWTVAIAAVLALALLIGGILPRLGGGSSGGTGGVPELLAHAVVLAKYPQMAPYPDWEQYLDERTGEYDDEGYMQAYDAWYEDTRALRELPEDYGAGIDGFLERTIRQFLSGGGENRVCSPLNIYMALGMLAELTDGESRGQILDLLGAESMESLRAQAAAMWRANYCDDGATASLLASSLWLNQDIEFVPATLEKLAETYYASAFQGEMGSESFNQALRDWLNQQTGGLLAEQAGDLSLDARTILALAATVYFRAQWHSKFAEGRTAPETFHATAGDVTCDFMYQSDSGSYYWGEKFSAVSRPLEGSGSMWFLLPDEGIAPEELLEDPQAMEFLLTKNRWEVWQDQAYLIINLSLPKFDVVSDLDLTEGLQALGITDVFDEAVSDFTPMTEGAKELEVYLSQARHAARVAIDEEGVTAVSYTMMAASGSGGPPEDEVDFVVDRPFLFAITGMDGLPLFVGVVNHPV